MKQTPTSLILDWIEEALSHTKGIKHKRYDVMQLCEAFLSILVFWCKLNGAWKTALALRYFYSAFQNNLQSVSVSFLQIVYIHVIRDQ